VVLVVSCFRSCRAFSLAERQIRVRMASGGSDKLCLAVCGSAGEAKAFPPLFDNYIGRKRDVGGGVLAGLCCLGLFLVERVGLCASGFGLLGLRADLGCEVRRDN
jgi:hypothetical protein